MSILVNKHTRVITQGITGSAGAFHTKQCIAYGSNGVGAARDLGLHLPVVVRIEGTNAPLGRKMLQESGLELIAAADLTDAAKKVVAAARK